MRKYQFFLELLTRFEEDNRLQAAALCPVGRKLPEPAHDLHHGLDLHVGDLVLGSRRDLRLPRGYDLRTDIEVEIHV